MNTFDSHRHFWLGENHQHFPGQEVIFKLSFPRVFIRYDVDRAIFADFDDFFASIAEVQWIDGDRPDDATQLQILADAWNFLCIEEQILERDMREDEDDEDFSELAKWLACPNCNWVSTGNEKDSNRKFCIHCGHSW